MLYVVAIFPMVSKMSLPPNEAFFPPLDMESTSASCVRVSLAVPKGSDVTGPSQSGGF